MEHVFEKCRKTALCLALAVVVVFAGVALASRDVRADEVSSGEGWSLTDDGTLTLTDSAVFSNYSRPWLSEGKDAIKHLVIGSGITTIPGNYFDEYTGLKTVTLSSDVTIIEQSAFSRCSALTTINLEGVKTIGSHAFTRCTKLTGIKFGNDIELGNQVFEGCTSLSSVDLGGLDKLPTGTFSECSSLKSIDLRGVKEIGDSALGSCSSLESVVMNNEITVIGVSSFYKCVKLENIDLKNIKRIEYNAFFGCTGLTSLDLTVVSSIGKNAFEGCTSLTTAKFGNNSVSVGDEAFKNCSKLTTIDTDKISSFNYGVFYSCKSLETVVLSSNITYIGKQAFSQCSSLKSINLGNITQIYTEAFADCVLLNNVDLSKCSDMEKYAFKGCKALTSLDLSGGYMYFEGVFQGCTGLTSVTLGEQLTNIPDYAFDGCTNLSTVNFDSVYVIGKYAFRNTKLTSLDLRYATVISDGAFSGCQVTDLTLGYRYGIYTHSGNPDTDSFVFDNITSFYFYGPQRIYDQRNLGADFPNATITIGGAYDVIFDYGNGESCTVIEEGETVDNPGDFSRDYFIFTGWYSDKECTRAYDFSLPVTKDIRIYAGWIKDLSDSFFKGYTVSLEGDIGVNYYTIIPEDVDMERDYIKFTLDDGSDEKLVYLKDATKVTYQGTTYSVFKIRVPAKKMTAVIDAKLYVNGQWAAEKRWSVKQYADYILDNPLQYKAAEPLVRAMLHYGAYAQIFFNYKTDKLANADLINDYTYSLDDAVFTRPYDSSKTNLPAGLEFSNVSLTLDTTTTLNLYFTDNTNKNLTFKVVNGTKETTITPKASGSQKLIKITNIPAGKLDSDFKLKIVVEGDSTEYFVTYSPMTYAYNIISREKSDVRTPELKNLMKALYLYSEAAKKYIGT